MIYLHSPQQIGILSKLGVHGLRERIDGGEKYQQLLHFRVEEQLQQTPLHRGGLLLRGDALLQQLGQLGVEGDAGQLGEQEEQLARILIFAAASSTSRRPKLLFVRMNERKRSSVRFLWARVFDFEL